MARTKAFSDTWISNLKPHPSKRRDFTEPGRRGFMLRVWPGGDKTFVCRYMRDGKTRIMGLGTYPATTLEVAHKAHSEALNDLKAGLDPIEARELRGNELKRQQAAEVAARDGRMTVRKLVDLYVKRGLVRRDGKPYDEPEQVERLLHAELLGRRFDRRKKEFVYDGPSWGDVAIDDFDLTTANEISDSIIDRGSIGTARVLRRTMKGMFEFAVKKRKLLPENPLVDLEGGKTPKGRRWLSQDEIRELWGKLTDKKAPMAEDSRLALKLLLVTGQRPGELCRARWGADVNLKAKSWRIPAGVSKNRIEHTIPLSGLAVELFERLREIHPEGDYVVPAYLHAGKYDLGRPRDAHSLPHGVRDNGCFGLEKWTPRDLRRTFQTHLARLRVAREVAQKIVNHKADELDEVYVHHDYMAEMVLAMRKWDRELRRIIAGKSNVVDIADKRA